MKQFVIIFLLLAGILSASDQPAEADYRSMMNVMQKRQDAISKKATAYLWKQRIDKENGNVGSTQQRYLQALCYLALVADGSEKNDEYKQTAEHLVSALKTPLASLEGKKRIPKLFVGTSREFIAFETNAVIALAYEQLAGSSLVTTADNQLFLNGSEAAINYVMDYRKRGRDYEYSGGWPVNSNSYNRTRPDRRCTAWQLLLLDVHQKNGRRVSKTALKEASNFILEAQRMKPRKTAYIKRAERTYKEWSPKLRRGEKAPEDIRVLINDYLEFSRKLDESGGFGVDKIGVVSDNATAVGLFTLALFQPESKDRFRSAVNAFNDMPIAWDSQRFFLSHFFASRALHIYSKRYRTMDYYEYMDRLLTLIEQKQSSDGSFPQGSRGVEELNKMEHVYTTAMIILIVNNNRGTLLFDR